MLLASSFSPAHPSLKFFFFPRSLGYPHIPAPGSPNVSPPRLTAFQLAASCGRSAWRRRPCGRSGTLVEAAPLATRPIEQMPHVPSGDPLAAPPMHGSGLNQWKRCPDASYISQTWVLHHLSLEWLGSVVEFSLRGFQALIRSDVAATAAFSAA